MEGVADCGDDGVGWAGGECICQAPYYAPGNPLMSKMVFSVAMAAEGADFATRNV